MGTQLGGEEEAQVDDPVIYQDIHLLNEPTKKANLQTYCQLRYKCLPCGTLLDPTQKPVRDHVCGEYRCSNCQQWFNPHETGMGHLCHMRALSSSQLKVDKFIFYDFECTQENDVHIPNLVVAQSCCSHCEQEELQDEPSAFCHYCGTRCSACDAWSNQEQEFEKYPCANGQCGKKEVVFRGDDVTEVFGQWLFSRQHRGVTAVAHNAKGYDNYFLYKYCLNHNMTPSIIFNGTKIMYMHQSKGLNLRCLDSCAFLPMALAELPACFDLVEMKKGFFPHFYNVPEHYFTIRQGLPDPEFYGVATMKTERQEEFYQWYQQHCHDLFDFEQEMLTYCRSDVDILKKACLRYRDVLMKATQIGSTRDSGIDPFGCVSAASVCMTVFRARFLPERWQVLLAEHNLALKQGVIHCAHRPGACDCVWTPARKRHGDAPLEFQNAQGNWISRKSSQASPVLAERFVESPVAIIPSSEYNSSDRYSQEAMAWLRSCQDELCRQAKTKECLLINHVHIQTALSPEGEKVVICPPWSHGPATRFKLDGYYVDPVTGHDMALEFYGCHFHGCPHCYVGRARKDIKVGLKSLDQRYQETLLREWRLREQGFHFQTIWACEWKTQQQQHTTTTTL